MDIVESNLYEEDFLSSFFDPTKDEFSSQTVYPNLKSSNAVDFDNSPFNFSLSEEESCSKVGREGGNPEEDEGFEGMSLTILGIGIGVTFIVLSRFCRGRDFRRFTEGQ